MKSRTTAGCVLALLCGVETLLTTAAASPRAAVAEVRIPNTRHIEFVSKVNGHRYAIDVALPFKAAPAQGYPVLYVLDGDIYFATATEAARTQRQIAGGIVVVGIGYPDDPVYLQGILDKRGPGAAVWEGLPPSQVAPIRERQYDMTLPTSEEELTALSREGNPKWKPEGYGGLDDFLKIIETEIKPRVAELARVNTANQALFGASLGGYAALHALFVQPQTYRTFILSSPAIWWDDKKVLADRDSFAAAVNDGRIHPRVFVAVGSEESTGLPARWAMVDNTRELVSWLNTLKGRDGYVVADTVFEHTGHALAPWPALARGIDFAFND